MKKEEKRRTVKVIGLVISILIIMFFVYSIVYFNDLKESFTSMSNENWFVLFLVSAFLEGFPQLFSPAVILTSIILAKSSPHLIILSVTLGSYIGSMAGFLIGYHYTEKALEYFVDTKKLKASKKTRHFLNKYGNLGLTIIAVTPIPYFPIVFGTMKMNKMDFMIFGAIPKALSYVAYGYFLWSFL